MKRLLQCLVMLLLPLGAYGAEYRYNGVKPAFIIDVRTAAEFATGHVDGAINIPYDQISQGIRTVKGAKKESPILVYCRSGRRSALAALSLQQQGFQHVIDGGGQQTLQARLQQCTATTC